MRMPQPHHFDGQDWSRWGQQQAADYPMMTTPPLMPFDSPSAAHGNDSKQIVTQNLGSSYMMPNHYQPGPAYDPHHRGPQYQQPMPFNYGQYTTPSPTAPITPPFKPQNQHRPDMRFVSPLDAQTYQQARARPTQYHELASSPMIKSDPYAIHPQAMPQDAQDGPQKNVNPIVPDDPTKLIEFNTPIDNLMRKYQRFGGSQASNSPPQLPTPAQSPRHLGDRRLPGRVRKLKTKSFACSKCDYVSSQKAHLRAHERTHTSELPYACPHCDKKCSQKGNLEVHIRAHKGDRAFRCDFPQCDSAGFFSKSNLAAHKRIHLEGRAKWVCKLEGCTKTFSSTGNRKAHHNKFHETEFNRLALLIDEYNRTGQCPDQDKALVEELSVIYKNSNKGIKGRGKGVKVEKMNERPALMDSSMPPTMWDHKTHSILDERQAAVGSVSDMLAPSYGKPSHMGHLDLMYRRDY
ncbi:hypothetical protein CC79DRAFT_1321575 [Sarocladium strictum]